MSDAGARDGDPPGTAPARRRPVRLLLGALVLALVAPAAFLAWHFDAFAERTLLPNDLDRLAFSDDGRFLIGSRPPATSLELIAGRARVELWALDLENPLDRRHGARLHAWVEATGVLVGAPSPAAIALLDWTGETTVFLPGGIRSFVPARHDPDEHQAASVQLPRAGLVARREGASLVGRKASDARPGPAVPGDPPPVWSTPYRSEKAPFLTRDREGCHVVAVGSGLSILEATTGRVCVDAAPVEDALPVFHGVHHVTPSEVVVRDASTLRWFELGTGRLLREWREAAEQIVGVAADGHRIALIAGATVAANVMNDPVPGLALAVKEVPSRRILGEWPLAPWPRRGALLLLGPAALSPDGSRVALRSARGEIEIHEVP